METGYIYLIVILLFYGLILRIFLAYSVLKVIATWKLYAKAGEHGWAAIVPVYEFFVKCRIAFGSFKKAWIYMGLIAGITAILTAEAIFVPMLPRDLGILRVVRFVLILVTAACYAVLLGFNGYLNYNFSKAYGKPLEWNICMIFFAPILTLILGFDKKTEFKGAKTESL